MSTAPLLLMLLVGLLTGAAQAGDVSVADLRANVKLHTPDEILADFVSGKPETAVIILLQPPAVARALADHSRMSTPVPPEFIVPGAPPFFNLRNETVKAQLRATVIETVSRAVDRLGPSGMAVTQRFSYQFGFAARVTPAALERIVNSPDVVAVEQDALLEEHLAQGIPLMNAATVRNTYTGSGLSIAICDTGIDTSHPRLGGGGGFPNAKVIGGYDTGDNDADPRPASLTGDAHGTACAGIAAGDTGTVGNYIGGVAPGAKLYAIKISTGTSGSALTSALIAGWEWAVTHQNDDPGNPIMIISTSFGGGRYTSTCDTASSSTTTAAANAVAAGITIFASSGNEGYCDSIASPACISYVNSVGAVYDAALGTLGFCVSSASCATKAAYPPCSPGYASWDPTAADKVTAYSNSASFLTLLAPSHNAYTTDIVGTGGVSAGDYYATFGGTSAASPYAAGSAAVLQQAAREKTGSYLTPVQVRDYLVSNGDSVTDGKAVITKPRINLGRAVDALPATARNFTMGASPMSVTVAAGGTANATISTIVSSGFDNVVSLAATGLPTGVTAAFSPSSIAAPGSGSSTLTLTTTTAVPAGSYAVTVTGTGGGDTRTVTFALTITDPSSITLLSQSFGGGGLPTDWTVTDNAGSGATWAFNDPGSRSNQTGGTDGFAIADSDHAGSVRMNTELRTPLLNLSGYSSATLKFKTYFNSYQSEIADVDVSSNGATGPWTSVWHKSGSDYAGAESVDISALAAGKPGVMIRYHYYNANNDWYWQVDDVTVLAKTARPTLTATIAGSGAGSVNSNPAGIACTTGTCTAQFPRDSSISLMATPGMISLFSGWSGACTNANGDCLLTMDSDKAVTATFSIFPPVRVAGTAPAYYSSLHDAYAAATEGSIIQAEGIDFTENLVLGRAIVFTLQGGFDSSFATQTGSTSLQSLTIQDGAVIIDRMTVR